MSVLYEVAKPAARRLAKGFLERGLKEPDSFIVKVKDMQEKPLPLKKLHRKYDFEETVIQGTICYKMHGQRNTGRKIILYFFGGGYCKPGTVMDFAYAKDMADRTNRFPVGL